MSSPRRRARWILALYGFCVLYFVPVFPHFVSPNEFSRWATVAGLVEHGTLDVRWAEPLIGNRVDAALWGGHLYSNKAPALAFLSAPGYLAARLFLGPPTMSNIRWSLYLMRVVGVTIPALALGAFLLRWSEPDPLAMAMIFFATPFLIYGALLFSHVTAGALLYLAYRLLFDPRSSPRPARDVLAGAACGLATLVEYPCALATAVLGAALLFGAERIRRSVRFVAGGLPFVALLAAYDWRLFGSIFSLSSAHESSDQTAALASRGIFGIVWPTFSSFWTIAGSPSRGLFFYSPILVFGLVCLLPRRGPDGVRRSWARFLVVAILFLAIAGYPANNGGWGAGARYLLLLVPLLVDAAHERRLAPNFAVSAALVFSVLLCVFPLLTFPFVPSEFEFVHATFSRPMLVEGFTTPNWGFLLLGARASLLPVLVAVAVATWLALRDGGRRAAAGALCGALLGSGVILAPLPDTQDLKFFRALLLETHFVPRGRIRRMAAESRDPASASALLGFDRAISQTRRLAPDDWPYLRAGRIPPDRGSRK